MGLKLKPQRSLHDLLSRVLRMRCSSWFWRLSAHRSINGYQRKGEMDPIERKPVAYHCYLTESSGKPLPIWRMTYGPEKCPLCPPIRAEAVLGVTTESPDGRAETVQCLACDYSATRPRRDPPGRLMNQRLLGPETP
ncbi:hypothetical protein Rctr197k_102 [Virus Rctr197k]|nr:hypothetical protein Rctr197k_102 [Virus Rctr197k]